MEAWYGGHLYIYKLLAHPGKDGSHYKSWAFELPPCLADNHKVLQSLSFLFLYFHFQVFSFPGNYLNFVAYFQVHNVYIIYKSILEARTVTSSSDDLSRAVCMEGITWDLNSLVKLFETAISGSSFMSSSIIVENYSETIHYIQCTMRFSRNTRQFWKPPIRN